MLHYLLVIMLVILNFFIFALMQGVKKCALMNDMWHHGENKIGQD
jgi:hypothetical protein